MPHLSFTQVGVGDVIAFGPRQRWALVHKILPGAVVHWEVIWVYGQEWGRREIVTPDERLVYLARTPEEARRDRLRVLL